MIFNSWHVQPTHAVRMESLVDRLIKMRRDIEELHRKNIEAINSSSGCYSLTTRKETS